MKIPSSSWSTVSSGGIRKNVGQKYLRIGQLKGQRNILKKLATFFHIYLRNASRESRLKSRRNHILQRVRRVLMIAAEQSIVAVCKRYSKVILVVASKIGSRTGLDIKNVIIRKGLCIPPEIFKILAFHMSEYARNSISFKNNINLILWNIFKEATEREFTSIKFIPL